MISSISEVGKHVGQDVTIQGWMYNRRSGKNIHFLQLRDGTGMMQGVCVQAEVSPEVWDIASKLTMESSCRVTGTVRGHPKDPNVFELTVKQVEAIQIADEFPISKKEHGPDFLLDHPNVAGVMAFHNAAGMILRGPGHESRRDQNPPGDDRVIAALGATGAKMIPHYRSLVTYKDLYPVHGARG